MQKSIEQRGTGWRIRTSLLAAVVAAVGVFAYRGLWEIESASRHAGELQGTEAFFFAPSSSSPSLILLLTLWFLWRRRRRILAACGSDSRPASGVALLAGALSIGGWAHYVGAPTLLVPSLSLALLGSALLLGGREAFRSVLVPAIFLLLAAPIPTVIVTQIIYPMQITTARLTSQILNTVGFNLVTHGERIYGETTIFQVIESCAGLGSVATLVMASFLYQELFYRSRLQSLLLVLASPALALVVNEIRVMTIVVNPYSRLSAVHTAQGLVMIAIGVLLIAALDWLLGTFLPPAPARTPASPPARNDRVSVARLAVVGSAVATLAALTVGLRPWEPARHYEPRLGTFPSTLEGGWSATGLKLERDFLGSVTFSEWVHRSYQQEDGEVDLFLGSDDRLDPTSSLISIKTAIPGSGWALLERGHTVLEPSGRRVESFVVWTGMDRELVYRWHYRLDSPAIETLRAIFVLDRGPFRRPGRALVVRISTPFGPEGGSREEAEARLQAFEALIEAPLATLVETDASPS